MLLACREAWLRQFLSSEHLRNIMLHDLLIVFVHKVNLGNLEVIDHYYVVCLSSPNSSFHIFTLQAAFPATLLQLDTLSSLIL